MLDKFLSRSSSHSKEELMQQKIQEYNKQVIESKAHIEFMQNSINYNSSSSYPDKFDKFQTMGKSFKKPNTYQTYKSQPKQYIDDGSYFCSYSTGGNTLVCYKNKEKVELVLDGIVHPDKNNYLAKRANYFLNDLVKKKKVFIEQKENGLYEIFLDSTKQESINSLMINEGYHNSQPYNPESKDKKTSFSKNKNEATISESTEEILTVKEKKNYAYGLFATNHNTFEALFNKEKITLKLDGLDNISKENQKICKSMIYDFVSKKSIVLKFIKEDNGVHFVEVFNKEGECLNNLIADKKFVQITATSDDISENLDSTNNTPVDEINEQCSEDDWNWTSDNNTSSSSDIDTPEVTNLPAMFKKPVSSNPNSPFAKKKVSETIIQSNINEGDFVNEDNGGEELDVPEITNLPAMFKKPISSNPNSPFAKKKIQVESEVVSNQTIKEDITNNQDIIHEIPVKKKLSFGKR